MYYNPNLSWINVWYVVHDDVIKWKHFPRYWPFVRGIYRSPLISPHNRPVARSFDVFFDLRLNKQLNKQSRGWWFETLSRSLWRHCNVSLEGMIDTCSNNSYISTTLRVSFMMTSSIGNTFCVTDPLWGESTGKSQWSEALRFSSICAVRNGWANNRDAGYLGRHRAHYDAKEMPVMSLVSAVNPLISRSRRYKLHTQEGLSYRGKCGRSTTGMGSVNERRCYIITAPLIGWPHI